MAEIVFWDDLAYTQIKAEIVSRLDNLKSLVKESQFSSEFLLSKETYKFSVKNLKRIPLELLQINQGAVSNLYKSALGGSKFLRDYGLKVESKQVVSWKAIKKEIRNNE